MSTWLHVFVSSNRCGWAGRGKGEAEERQESRKGAEGRSGACQDAFLGFKGPSKQVRHPVGENGEEGQGGDVKTGGYSLS